MREILTIPSLSPGAHVIDATLGLGGHAHEILKKIGPKGSLLAFEWDERNREIARQNLKHYCNIDIVPLSFSQMESECKRRGCESFDFILFDFGISSAHLDDPERGFSYRFEAPLDLRMDTSRRETAADLIAELSESDLSDLFWKLGEERRSRQIAAKICETRKQGPIRTTTDLFAILEEVCPKNPKKTASRIFQALRIAVNHELDEIEKAIPQAFDLLAPGGHIATISFHSLEDRLVKNLFREKEKNEKIGKEKIWQRVNKKVIIPQPNEQKDNPRSRSAKLRIIRKNKPQRNS